MSIYLLALLLTIPASQVTLETLECPTGTIKIVESDEAYCIQENGHAPPVRHGPFVKSGKESNHLKWETGYYMMGAPHGTLVKWMEREGKREVSGVEKWASGKREGISRYFAYGYPNILDQFHYDNIQFYFMKSYDISSSYQDSPRVMLKDQEGHRFEAVFSFSSGITLRTDDVEAGIRRDRELFELSFSYGHEKRLYWFYRTGIVSKLIVYDNRPLKSDPSGRTYPEPIEMYFDLYGNELTKEEYKTYQSNFSTGELKDDLSPLYELPPGMPFPPEIPSLKSDPGTQP